MSKAGRRVLETSPHALEERLVRRDRVRLGVAFGAAVLLHASTALSLVYWEPPEPLAPPGEMTITIDLAAAYSQASADQAGVTKELVPQTPQPPTPPEEPTKEEEVVEEVEPAPEPLIKEEVAEVPKAEEAEVIIAPKQQKEKKKKPTPQAVTPSPAAAAAATTKSEVSGRGASASPSEINAYLARVRSAIERNKKIPSGGGKGIAYVAFTITRSGDITGLRLSRSSGAAVLDSAARTTVASAGLPPIPEGIPAPINLGVPINFR
ncbi:hypothetical protein IZ6_08030 [Terrihabitans soli]|uniref:TonB C-terminal domain-containing protein n=1 Tax=Terrihabitans soli TaxID=708113 RepID=A0A6S6QUB5_9HYPH|nr:energy transducer TonB [Terrihabitans soli]BCJ90068.1 hypothetical protein IZ6_08030 [Terrihabitans soli]